MLQAWLLVTLAIVIWAYGNEIKRDLGAWNRQRRFLRLVRQVNATDREMTMAAMLHWERHRRRWWKMGERLPPRFVGDDILTGAWRELVKLWNDEFSELRAW